MTWTLALAFANIVSATVILFSGIELARRSKSPVAKLVFIMFLCIAVEIVMVTIALFLPLSLQTPVRFLARCVELSGILWFGVRLPNITTEPK